MIKADIPSRRNVLRGGLATACKVTQSSVQYHRRTKGDQNRDDCIHFAAESNGCMLIDGPIITNGWCSLWSKKIRRLRVH